jgi:hypothetical protein
VSAVAASVAIAAVGVAVSAASAGYAISGAGNPTYAAPSNDSTAVANMNMELLPYQRQLQSLAETGGKGTIYTPAHQQSGQFVTVTVPGGSTIGYRSGGVPITSQNSTITIPADSPDLQPGGKYAGMTVSAPFASTQNVPAGNQTYDFTGLGQAEVQGKVAAQMAAVQQGLNAKYDPQFIATALQQEALANPNEAPARAEMSNLIQSEVSQPTARPVASMLDEQVKQQLDAANAGTLTDQNKAQLDSAVGSALSDRGGGGAPGANFESPLTTGFAGQQRQEQAAGKGTSWLTSGATPEDIAYRQQQQNMANLSAEVNGQTPQSEFRSLSGAQQGPTPSAPGAPLMQVNTNGQTPQANQAGVQQSGITNNFNANQAGSWASGITAAMNVARVGTALSQPGAMFGAPSAATVATS